jgi:hypothetical protein
VSSIFDDLSVLFSKDLFDSYETVVERLRSASSNDEKAARMSSYVANLELSRMGNYMPWAKNEFWGVISDIFESVFLDPETKQLHVGFPSGSADIRSRYNTFQLRAFEAAQVFAECASPKLPSGFLGRLWIRLQWPDDVDKMPLPFPCASLLSQLPSLFEKVKLAVEEVCF